MKEKTEAENKRLARQVVEFEQHAESTKKLNPYSEPTSSVLAQEETLSFGIADIALSVFFFFFFF